MRWYGTVPPHNIRCFWGKPNSGRVDSDDGDAYGSMLPSWSNQREDSIARSWCALCESLEHCWGICSIYTCTEPCKSNKEYQLTWYLQSKWHCWENQLCLILQRLLKVCFPCSWFYHRGNLVRTFPTIGRCIFLCYTIVLVPFIPSAKKLLILQLARLLRRLRLVSWVLLLLLAGLCPPCHA